MDQFTKDLIEARAVALARVCERILNLEDETDEVAGAGFRWAYLLLRRPKKFLEIFQHFDLRIDPSLLQDAVWTYQDEIPGPNSLLPEERKILTGHNNEASDWMRDHSIPKAIGLSCADSESGRLA